MQLNVSILFKNTFFVLFILHFTHILIFDTFIKHFYLIYFSFFIVNTFCTFSVKHNYYLAIYRFNKPKKKNKTNKTTHNTHARTQTQFTFHWAKMNIHILFIYFYRKTMIRRLDPCE